MPKRYESIRDSLVAIGVSLKEAKTRAARIFNSTRKEGETPVTGKHKKKKKTKPGAMDDNAMRRARNRKRKMKRIIEEE